MRTHLFRPAAPGRYPGTVLSSEIVQVTAPIRRTAALLAGHGFIVAVPAIYHEFEPAGTVLASNQAGADRGNRLKTPKPLAACAALHPTVLAATCLSATDIHKRGRGAGLADDTLDRIPAITGELLLIWGRQDPTCPSRATSVSKPL